MRIIEYLKTLVKFFYSKNKYNVGDNIEFLNDDTSLSTGVIIKIRKFAGIQEYIVKYSNNEVQIVEEENIIRIK